MRILTSVLLCLLFCFSVLRQERKVLVVGIDGCRPDAIAASATPNLDNLIENGLYSPDALNDDITISGPGWSAILCGVWPEKHLVTDNSFSEDDYESFPSFFSYVEEANPDLNTISICHWNPIKCCCSDPLFSLELEPCVPETTRKQLDKDAKVLEGLCYIRSLVRAPRFEQKAS